MSTYGPLWRGGSGRPGTQGGWGYRCPDCNKGTKLAPMRNKQAATDAYKAHRYDDHGRTE